LTTVTGGPNVYAGRDMKKAHEHLKLKNKHFNQIKKHLMDN